MKKISILLIAVIMIGCRATTVDPDSIIQDIKTSSNDLRADGSTIIDVWAYIDKNADADKRGVIFSSNIGTFVPSNDTTATVTAGFENGLLVARTKYKMPLTGGQLILKARTITVNRFYNPKTAGVFKIEPSVPATLKILPSFLGLKTGFANEITLTATLKNALGNNVSAGTKVLFKTTPSVGSFRSLRDSTDATSTAVCTYSAGATAAPSTVTIRCTYLDKAGNKTSVSDLCTINISN